MNTKEVFSHAEISTIEGLSLQKGMNFRPAGKKYSIFLMSVDSKAPYNDGFREDGKTLIYEGEDISRREKPTPKKLDQPLFTKTGKPTNNGIFFKAAEDYKYERRQNPERIKVYEKVTNNVWSDKGMFDLVDVEYIFSEIEKRKVFKFVLRPISLKAESLNEEKEFEFSRRIPTEIKRLVWERDNGSCTECGSKDNLHFDHVIPYSKGGSSKDVKNIQILCGKHNLSKSDKIS